MTEDAKIKPVILNLQKGDRVVIDLESPNVCLGDNFTLAIFRQGESIDDQGRYNVYTVVKGDNIKKISKKVYGNEKYYTRLIEKNESLYPSIARKPYSVGLGWQLRY